MGSSTSMAVSAQAPPLTRKLACFVSLSATEIALLNELQSSMRTVRRNGLIAREGRRVDNFSVIMEGIAIRYRALKDGRRQIIDFILPGDLIHIGCGISLNSSIYSVAALTNLEVSDIENLQMQNFITNNPHLAIQLIWWMSCESAIYAERIVDLGKRSATERLAHFFMEMLIRLQAVGLADECSYRLPLSQRLIGDAVGLTHDHLGRVLRRLRDDNLVAIEDQRVSIKDIKRLSELADFEPGYLTGISVRGFLEG
jgi:CRP-like cAMP-binding protein